MTAIRVASGENVTAGAVLSFGGRARPPPEWFDVVARHLMDTLVVGVFGVYAEEGTDPRRRVRERQAIDAGGRGELGTEHGGLSSASSSVAHGSEAGAGQSR